MVFFNYATMQMAAKIVYYGPGLCGKTTNLHHIYAKTSPTSRGEMVSLETETDRTLFFDLLPIDVGVIGGFKTRLQLYTVPGQVFYNTTRKLVLKGADGIVFVADSQRPMLDANLESLKNLRENLAEIGLNLDEIPVVLQLNKRDLPGIASIDEMVDKLDPNRQYEWVEATAVNGGGVFETLKTISKLTLRTLRRRMMGEEAAPLPEPKNKPVFLINSQPSAPKPPTPAEVQNSFPAAVIENAPSTARAQAVAERDPEEVPEDSEVVAGAAREHVPAATIEAQIDNDVISDTPIPELPAARQPAEPEVLAEPAAAAEAELPAQFPADVRESAEPELQFETEEKPAKSAPEVKHVKVRSGLDIMAELEQLRKKATSSSAARKKEFAATAPDALAPKKESSKQLSLSFDRSTTEMTKSLRVTVEALDASGNVLQSIDSNVETPALADISSLTVNLKLDLGSGQ